MKRADSTNPVAPPVPYIKQSDRQIVMFDFKDHLIALTVALSALLSVCVGKVFDDPKQLAEQSNGDMTLERYVATLTPGIPKVWPILLDQDPLMAEMFLKRFKNDSFSVGTLTSKQSGTI